MLCLASRRSGVAGLRKPGGAVGIEITQNDGGTQGREWSWVGKRWWGGDVYIVDVDGEVVNCGWDGEVFCGWVIQKEVVNGKWSEWDGMMYEDNEASSAVAARAIALEGG